MKMKTPLFKAIMIETVAVCNRSCWFCMYGQRKYILAKAKINKMPWKSITKILCNLKDLNYTGRVSWYRINEPLLDKRIYKILELTKKYLPICHQTITTNGDFLDQATLDRLMQSGLDHLSITIYDDKSFKKVNELKISNHVTIKDRRTGYKWENRGGNIAKLRSQRNDGNCHRPSSGLNVMTSGEVSLCCADLYGGVIMGNVHEQRLEKIWYGKRFQEYRERLLVSRAGLRLCEHCDHDGRGHNVYGNSLPLSTETKGEIVTPVLAL